MRQDNAGRIVIAGGTGFLGLNLARQLAAGGSEVVLISRHPPAVDGDWTHAHWDARGLGEWPAYLEGAAALVNLVGRTVDCIKTPDHRDEILRSRVEATRVLGRALREVRQPPRSGSRCRRRTSMAILPRWCATRTRPTGISWIHERDMNRLFERAIADDSMTGAYLATAPNPVSNADFMRELRRAVGMPIGLPAAAWMVRLGAPLALRTDPELALYGRYCVSHRLRDEGFDFEFPELGPALRDLYRS